MRRMHRLAGMTAVVAGVGLGLVGVLEGSGSGRMGPPAVCHEVAIGSAKSLEPVNVKHWQEKPEGLRSVIGATLKLLDGEGSALVRMETLRRATVVTSHDRAVATELLGRVSWRAMDAEARGTDAEAGRAWFDAAYLAGCFGQMGDVIVGEPGASHGALGYLWMQRAIRLSGENAEMEYGAAMIVHPLMVSGAEAEFKGHMERAKKGASEGSLVAANIKRHEEIWGEDLRRVLARRADAGDRK